MNSAIAIATTAASARVIFALRGGSSEPLLLVLRAATPAFRRAVVPLLALAVPRLGRSRHRGLDGAGRTARGDVARKRRLGLRGRSGGGVLRQVEQRVRRVG